MNNKRENEKWQGIRQEWSMMNQPLPMLLRSMQGIFIFDKVGGGMQYQIEQPMPEIQLCFDVRRNLPESEREPTTTTIRILLPTLIERRDIL